MRTRFLPLLLLLAALMPRAAMAQTPQDNTPNNTTRSLYFEDFEDVPAYTDPALSAGDLPMVWYYTTKTGTSYRYWPKVCSHSCGNYQIPTNGTLSLGDRSLYMASCSSSEVGDTYAIWTGYDCLITSVSFNSWRETNNGTLYLGYMTDPIDLSTFHSLQALTPPVYTSANANNATFAYTFNNNEIPYGAYLVFCWQQTNESNVRSVYLDNVSINYILPRNHIANIASNTQITWAEFAAIVNAGYTYENKTVYLDEDIDATTMVGTNENICFQGTFEGNGNTITFNHTNNAGGSANWYHGLFRYLNGATIQNLKVNGTITTNAARCGGLAGHCYGDNTITNCLSDITINSSLSSDGTYGGFVSIVRTGTTTFEGCAFTGRLLGSGTYKSGGLVGSTVTTVVFNNCVFAPTEVTIGLNNSATFSREFYPDSSVISINNSYYTFDFNDGTVHVGQGKQRYTVTGRNPVSVAMDGTATNYDVSHITAYSGTPGLLYDGTIFAGSDEQLSINLEGSSSYSANHGTLNGTANPYTLGMEACNTIISAAIASTDVLFSTGFEDGCDWTFVNGDRINQWCYGTAAHYDDGTHGIYISNDGGATNAYTDGATAYVNDMGDLYYTMVYAYKTFSFETGAYNISFDWRARGSFTYDYMRAALVPASVNLEADRYRPAGFSDNSLPEGWIALDGGSRLNESAEWQTQYNGFWVPADGNYKVVFAWFNASWYGGQPPAAIDNVSITQASCPTPSNLAATNVTASTAHLAWNGTSDVDSYTLKYRTADDIVAPFGEDFESADSFANWQAFGASNTGNNFGRRTAAARTGSYGFSFSSRYNATEYSQYLISPEINVGGDLEFYFCASQNNYTEVFYVGYSSTGNNVDDFVWGQARATSYADFWRHFQETVPEGTKYIAIHYTSQGMCELYVDDITIGAYQVQAGEWQEVTVEGGSQNMEVTLSGLTPETLYEAYAYPDCNPDKVSEPAYFRTMETCPAPTNLTVGNLTTSTADLSWTGEPDVESYTANYRAIPDGEWQTATVAGNANEVNATLTGLTPETEYEAYVYPDCNPGKVSNTVFFMTEAGSAFSMTISGHGNTDGHWHLIALPVTRINPDNVEGMTTSDYDLYRFNPLHNDNEWENYKAEGVSFNLEAGKGYLYARSTDATLTFVEMPYSGNGEFALNYDSNDEHKCWNLVGNPYNTPASIDKPFYRMNEGGTALSAQMEAGCVVEAMEGVFVQATAAGQSATFTPVPSHEYVDLGLPSGLLWATCNVGADTPEGYGKYFAWGETQPKDYYDWSTYRYCMGTENTLTKYCQYSSYGYNGFTDDLTTLEPNDDAATANWGNGWRMPTEADFEELYNNTDMIWTQQNGVIGRLFIAMNGNSLFLPAAGYRYRTSFSDVGSYGYYWTSSLFPFDPFNEDFSLFAWYFDFHSDDSWFGNHRNYGFTVRPVRSARQN